MTKAKKKTRTKGPVDAGVALTTACTECGKCKIIMIEMAPGIDGKPWYLCTSCWRQGTR